ncbi:hypothetical protein H072_3188 [Dactylellina haptotyla CBS 200.50]|uniref:Histone-lysine N-methyltransferase n=1 Tax=Dactylellina haptotyla (strain CBS 200.50) TaxID=1284197 RepID=S8C5B4_DACHA|nr:hypothetical protein H072_3188 [Dactylellina haptotyla CBS 200.50]
MTDTEAVLLVDGTDPQPTSAVDSQIEADDSADGGNFEILKIVGDKRVFDPATSTKQLLYQVRWKNYSKDHDTWEPIENLDGCDEVIETYLRKKALKEAESQPKPVKKRGPGRPRKNLDGALKNKPGAASNGSRKRSRSHSTDSDSEFIKRRTNSATKSLNGLKLHASPDTQPKQRSPEIDHTASHPDRLKFMENLGVLKGPAITVVNGVDMVPCPPLDFKFVNDYVYREGVRAPDPEFMWGCKTCKGAYGCQTTQIENCECSQMNHEELTRLPYKVNGFLKFPRECAYAIHECNQNCACNHRCPNKVVLKGRQIPLEIFKTENKGWGLRCPVDLKAGQFIDRYVGEVITEAEAERRTGIQEMRGLTYLFDLDKFNDEREEQQDTEMYSVDGGDYGGVTRFINHSCEPNLMIHAVTHNRSDLSVYDLALFTSRKIPAGEELTFEYVRNDDLEPGQEIPEDKKKFPCYCGAKKCHGWLF